jgi:hypothetical protein
MNRTVSGTGVAVGVAAILAVYSAFLVHAVVKAGRAERAVGVGVLLYVVTRPMLVVCAAAAFVMVLYLVSKK